jgi:hypothetical protein
LGISGAGKINDKRAAGRCGLAVDTACDVDAAMRPWKSILPLSFLPEETPRSM